MSEAISKGASVRVVQAAALIVVLGVLVLATQLAPEARSVVGTMAGLGVLLLAGTLMSELAEIVRLPHLSGYLAAGVLAGPHALKLVDHETVVRLQPINGLTLALIALAGGATLRIEMVVRLSRSLLWATVCQSVVVLVGVGAVFYWLAPITPFAALPSEEILAIALLWGVLAVSRSPTALLALFAQLRPRGPLTDFSLAFVMFSDVVVILMMAVAVALVRPILEPGVDITLSNVGILGHEILGSVALGVTLGLGFSVYLRLAGKNLLLVLLLLGVGMSEFLRYIQFDAMLAFLVAGFVVENFSGQGPKLLRGIENTGAVVFVIFFAVAGAELDLRVVQSLFPVALALCTARALTTWWAARLSSRFAEDEPSVARWGWTPMISQAGLTLGLSLVVVRAFPTIADAFRSIALAAVAVNEIVGPVLFKLALDRTGETRAGDEPEAPLSAG